MTTTSYPAVGQGGFTEEQWRLFYKSADGIYEDYATTWATSAFAKTNGTNQVTIKANATAYAQLDGYRLNVSVDHVLSCPDPASTTTYYVAVKYDPAANIADPVTGDADPDGPLSLICSAGVPTTAGGESYMTLFYGSRNPGVAVSAMVWADTRRWIGMPPSSQHQALAAWVDDPLNASQYPRGTFRFSNFAGPKLEVRTINDAGSALTWKEIT